MIYQGTTIERATFGHWNVFRADGGFVGGFSSLAEAKTYIDEQARWARITWTTEDLGNGRYRMHPSEAI